MRGLLLVSAVALAACQTDANPFTDRNAGHYIVSSAVTGTCGQPLAKDPIDFDTFEVVPVNGPVNANQRLVVEACSGTDCELHLEYLFSQYQRSPEYSDCILRDGKHLAICRQGTAVELHNGLEIVEHEYAYELDACPSDSSRPCDFDVTPVCTEYHVTGQRLSYTTTE